MKMVLVNDINIDELSDFKSLKDRSLRKEGHIIAESEKVVIKALDSNHRVLKILATHEFYQKHKSKIDSQVETVFIASKELMNDLVGFHLHHGIIALCERPSYVTLDELDNRVLIYNGLTSPENVGTIVRNAAAFGITSLIIDDKTVTPYARRCIRVSMGNIFNVKIHFTSNLIETIKKLQENNYIVCSTANQNNATDLPNYSFNSKSAVIIGSEGHGIEKDVLAISDDILRIPIDGYVAHLNAACSSSIVLYALSLNEK